MQIGIDDLRELSEDMQIPLSRFVDAIRKGHIIECNACDLSEARNSYIQTPVNSDGERAALHRIMELHQAGEE